MIGDLNMGYFATRQLGSNRCDTVEVKGFRARERRGYSVETFLVGNRDDSRRCEV